MDANEKSPREDTRFPPPYETVTSQLHQPAVGNPTNRSPDMRANTLGDSPTDVPPPPYDQATQQAQAYTVPAPAPAQQTHSDGKPRLPTPVQALLGSSTSSSSQTRHAFPDTFHLYRSGWSGRKCHLGIDRNTPLYAVSLHTGFSGKPNLVLHSGPDAAAPALASFRRTDRSDAIIELPAPPGSGLAHAEEQLRCHYNLVRYEYHAFSVEVDPAGAREAFEWRHTSGNPKLGRGQFGDSGWKLVRLAADGGADGHAPAGRVTSDGKEVVMTFSAAPASMTKLMTKLAYFIFCGSGAADGTLGDRWRLMAVMSARAYSPDRLAAPSDEMADREIYDYSSPVG